LERLDLAAAPAAGAYSSAVVVDGLVFASGQVGRNVDGTLSEDMGVQLERCFERLVAICQGAGTRLDCAVRTTVYLIDVNDRPLVDEAFREWFGDALPARTTIGVGALPGGARVEIDWSPLSRMAR
jgi:2-iminobutanoate/2-iminopropanoate deaminase